MTSSKTDQPNGFVRNARRVYHPLGFKKGYNFILFFIFGGALLGFIVARFQFLSIDRVMCSQSDGSIANKTLPGECFYYQFGHERIGIFLHLICILPAGFLAIWQFVPVIRHKLIIFHRINGYIIVLLALLGNAGALMIARHAFGGGFSTQTAIGVLVILTTLGLFMAWINIKRLQIDQHRAWMLRTWFYFGTIITMRLIMIIAANISSSQGNYFVEPCKKIDYIYKGDEAEVLKSYPGCSAFYDGSNPAASVMAKADMSGSNVVQIVAAMNMTFGGSIWLALALHAVGIEIYLHLTPREAARLRHVSYERQLEAGMSHPGDAGLTAHRLGDADHFTPAPKEHIDSRGPSAGRDTSEHNTWVT